ncbi:MAG TPA: hypothetical protein VLZ53_06555 [Devosia sp.]|nr:hypothetical protein [Devosia sp.]
MSQHNQVVVTDFRRVAGAAYSTRSRSLVIKPCMRSPASVNVFTSARLSLPLASRCFDITFQIDFESINEHLDFILRNRELDGAGVGCGQRS